MQHAVFHTFAFLAFSCLAFSTLAFWCRIFMSRNFMSRIFSVPASAYRPLSAFKTQEMSDIVKRDSDTSFALFVQTKLEFRVMISKVIYLFKHRRQRAERYDTRCYFNVRSKADISQLNLPHGTDN